MAAMMAIGEALSGESRPEMSMASPQQYGGMLEFKRKQNHQSLQRKRGLTEWSFPEGYIWALNEKNAKRKAKAKGWTHLVCHKY